MERDYMAGTAQTTMRAAVLHARGDLRIEQVPIPEPGPGELLIAVETVGVCGTDAAEFARGPKQFPLHHPHPVTGHVGPLIPGHEFSGRVAAIGSGVDGIAEGALMACAGAVSCGRCDHCDGGRMNLCRKYWTVGLHRHGALAEYCVAPASACLPVQAGVTADQAALAQPMAIAVHALRRGRVAKGEDVVIIGAGGIGMFLTYAAATSGCRVLAVDLNPERLAIAESLGADHTLVAGHTDAGEEVRRRGNRGTVVFEVTGSEAGLAAAMHALAPGGRIVVVGFQQEPRIVDLASLTYFEHELLGTNGLDVPSDLPEAVRLLASRRAPWSDVAPTVLPLEQVVDGALRPIARGASPSVKTLLSPRATIPRPARM